MITIEILNEIDTKAYNEFLYRCDYSSFSSTLKFKNILEWLIGVVPCYLIAKDQGKIVGLLPIFIKEGKYGKILNSLPWFGSNPGVLVADEYIGKGSVIILLLRAFNNIAKAQKAIASTIITRPFLSDNEMDIYTNHTKYTHLDSRIGAYTYLPEKKDIQYSMEMAIMNIINSKTRNMVRKAQKSDIKAYKANLESGVKALHILHKENMEKIGGPIKSLDLLLKIYNDWIEGEDYNLYLAEKDNKIIAGLLLKYFNKTVDYLMPAIDVNYRQYQPLSLLIFEAMKEAIDKGYKYWNWGGTTIPGQEGVLHFKKSWGAKTCKYKYFTKVYDKLIYNVSKEELLKEYPYFYVYPFNCTLA